VSTHEKYASYFQSTILEFVNYIQLSNPNLKILLVTHDWAQHSIKGDQKFSKNISKNIHNVVSKNSFTRHLHIRTTDYPANMNLEDIYEYPNDSFSHLRDYSILSGFIAKSLSEKSNS